MVFSLPAYTLPAISDILMGTFAKRKVLLDAALYTLSEAVLGYGLGCVIGIALAILITMAPPTRGFLLPAATAINSVPVVAYSPLILLWFGMGMRVEDRDGGARGQLHGLPEHPRGTRPRRPPLGRSDAQFRRRPPCDPLALATADGAAADGGRHAGLDRAQHHRRHRHRDAGAYGGLGWLIFQAVLQIDFVQVWSAIFVASAASLVFFGLIGYAERKIIFWK